MPEAKNIVYLSIVMVVQRVYVRYMIVPAAIALGTMTAGIIGTAIGLPFSLPLFVGGSVGSLGLLTGGIIPYSLLMTPAREAVRRLVETPEQLEYVIGRANVMAGAYPFAVHMAILVAATAESLTNKEFDFAQVKRDMIAERQ